MAPPPLPPAPAPASPPTPLLASWRDDLPAAAVVFLVALPLCLGLALAVGAPLMSGVIAGIIGGLLVGALSGSTLIVSGPAITMTAILMDGILSLGSFSRVLPAIVLGGVVQLLLGSLRAGVFAAFIPSSVLRGMLAAIGLTLVLKQIPHALGYDRDFEGDFAFLASTGETTFESIVRAVQNLQPGALVVALLGIAVIVAWPRTPLARYRLVPAPLVAVLLGVLVNELLGIVAPAYAVAGDGLVSLPSHMDGDLWTGIPRPDWTALRDPDAWTLALTIGVVASLESLLTMEGTSRLDPRREAAGADRELLAQGAGNILAGLAGGLPVAGAMVRSAVNVSAGARSRLSTIAHGALLLVAVLALEPFLDRIPLAALAAILLVTGYRLAEPAVWRAARGLGGWYFWTFVVTVVAILFSDLVVGMAIGLAVGVAVIMWEHLRRPVFTRLSPPGTVLTRYALPDQVTFLSKPGIAKALEAIPPGSRVELDGRQTTRFDVDALEIIHRFRATARERQIDYRLVGIPDAEPSTSPIP